MDSKLQIISGKYRGRKLARPADARPTQNRARIALFNMLESGILQTDRPMVIWDAFAGSGAFGIEFLSRYDNASVIFTDNSADSFKTVTKNIFGMPGGRVEMTDALNAVKRHGPIADVIFIDPPYEKNDLGQSLIRKLAMVAKVGAIVIWEIEDGTDFKLSDVDWVLLRDKTYGRGRFLILEKA